MIGCGSSPSASDIASADDGPRWCLGRVTRGNRVAGECISQTSGNLRRAGPYWCRCAEAVYRVSLSASFLIVAYMVDSDIGCYHRLDDETSVREKAFKTVAQGQKSENLLDFDEPEANGEGLRSSMMGGGLSSTSSGSTGIGAKAPISVLTSSNPLDDLASIFGSSSLAVPTHSPSIPSPLTPFSVTPTAPKPQPSAQKDLLGIF
jgi:hypothetical protein